MDQSRRPSPAMLVACIALVSSLCGNAIAAKVLITKSSQIKNGAVTGSDVRNSSLKSADVKNGSLSAKDLSAAARAELKGATGPAGATGATGAQGAKGDTGPAGPIEGVAAGGDLTGTYPNPTIAASKITSNKIASDAVTATKLATGAVTADAIGPGAVGVGELTYTYLQSQLLLTTGSNIANNACTAYANTGVVGVPIGAQSLILETRDPGWSAEGTVTTVDGSIRVRMCNRTGSTNDPPAAPTVTVLVLRP